MGDLVAVNFGQGSVPEPKACGNCAFFVLDPHHAGSSKCLGTGGGYAHFERSRGVICGPNGRLWQEAPLQAVNNKSARANDTVDVKRDGFWDRFWKSMGL